MQKKSSGATRQFVWGLAVALAVGAGYFYFHGHKAMQQSAPPPAAVTVKTLVPQQVRAWTEFSGRLVPVNAAQIRPEVSGRIVELKFEDGQEVKAGQVLFVIDPRPFEAAVAKAQAAVSTARTNAKFAHMEEKRASGMMKSQAIARRLYDERVAAAHNADAAVNQAEAELKRAEVDLEHAHVRSPIRGRAGRAELTEGNVVEAGPSAPLLTTVVSSKFIYADFEIDEQTYMQQARHVTAGRAREQAIAVELTVKGDTAHRYSGTIYSFDNHIDPASGTMRARAKFANSDGALVPGMFVTVRLASGEEGDVLLVPERAIGFDQNKKFLYVVGADNKVLYREVELGRSVGSDRMVVKGVTAGERVVVDGVQHVRPDAIVTPTEEGAAPATAAPVVAPEPEKLIAPEKPAEPAPTPAPPAEEKK